MVAVLVYIQFLIRYHRSMYKSDEVYPGAPLVLAACELRYPSVDSLTSPRQLQRLKMALADHFPLSKPAVNQKMTVRSDGSAEMTEEHVPRFTRRDRMGSVTISSESTVIELTRYDGFGPLLELLASVAGAVVEIVAPDGLERFGMRYVDEIRVPMNGAEIDWAEWLRGDVLGPRPDSIGLELQDWQSAVRYVAGEGHSVVLRYGPRVGFAVNPSTALMRPSVGAPGPFFLLDIDSFWEAPGEVPPFESAFILETAARLHGPVRGLFEALITDRLRNEVLRHA